jgi:hypothetical protein
MNIPMFNQSKIRKDDGNMSLTLEAEAIRLSNELRAQPARSYINIHGVRVDLPAKQGFDCETADFMTMVNWLADTRIIKSESLIVFVHRILSVRFPTEYAQYRDNINARYKLEYEMIQSNAKNDIFWLGEVGFSNMVRYDNSLTNNKNKILKQRNGEIKVIRK